MNEESDQISSGEGGYPPSQEPLRRRRIRKLSGPERDALGELAFILYSVCEPDMQDKWLVLRAKLLAWRSRFL